MEALIESIKRHEGFRDRVYLDNEGKPTCGWGHHLWVGSKVPLIACEEFFKQDVAAAMSAYQTILPYLRKRLNTVRARVIVEMIFNMNISKVLQFREMWTAIEDNLLMARCLNSSGKTNGLRYMGLLHIVTGKRIITANVFIFVIPLF